MKLFFALVLLICSVSAAPTIPRLNLNIFRSKAIKVRPVPATIKVRPVPPRHPFGLMHDEAFTLLSYFPVNPPPQHLQNLFFRLRDLLRGNDYENMEEAKNLLLRLKNEAADFLRRRALADVA